MKTYILIYEGFAQFEAVLTAYVVTDAGVVTAKAEGYVDFAIELGKVMDIYENEDDLAETIKFFRCFNDRK